MKHLSVYTSIHCQVLSERFLNTNPKIKTTLHSCAPTPSLNVEVILPRSCCNITGSSCTITQICNSYDKNSIFKLLPCLAVVFWVTEHNKNESQLVTSSFLCSRVQYTLTYDLLDIITIQRCNRGNKSPRSRKS